MSNYQRPIQPDPQQLAGNAKSSHSVLILVIVIVVLAVLLAMFACVGIAVYQLVQPAVNEAKKTAFSNASKNNLKLIGLSLHNYHDTYAHFPAAYSTTVTGQPALSWRASILPHLGKIEAYDSLDFAKPWDSTKNEPVANTSIPEFCMLSLSTARTDTAYVAVVDPESIFPPNQTTGFKNCKDGVSNTIMVIEVRNSNINWLEPRDFSIDEAVDYILNSSDPVNILLADGTVKRLDPKINSNTLRALMTREGEEIPGG